MLADAARAILGIGSDAPQDEIRRAWRGLALRSHPDKHPGDPDAARRFRECTDAYKALSHSEVVYKSYEQLCAEMDDTRDALLRAQELASKMRAAPAPGDNKQAVKLLAVGPATWIGEVAAGRPHGNGDLVLPNGSVHHGTFVEGRAHGEGVLYDSSGSVMAGEWVENKRVGAFTTTDPKGGTWHDRYEDGKRVARKKGEPPAPGAGAIRCRSCGVRFNVARNSRCLLHTGKWVEAPTHNADGSEAVVDRVTFPEGGLWLCCGSKVKQGRGCTVGVHTAEEPPQSPAVLPVDRRIQGAAVAAEEAAETVADEEPSETGAAGPTATAMAA